MAKPKEILLYDEPPKKKTNKDKKKKLKQKQKQKQIVKTNVKVNVQSSGGAGAGAGYVPMQFQDRTGENMKIQNLIDTLQKQTSKAPVVAPIIPQPGQQSSMREPQLYSSSKQSTKLEKGQSRRSALESYDPFNLPSLNIPSEYFISASDMTGGGGRVRIPSKSDNSNLSLYDRVSIGNNNADNEMNLIQDLQNERQSSISSGDFNNALEIGEEIDDADDRLNVINNNIQNDLESKVEAKPKRKYRTKEEIARDEALKPPKNPVGRPSTKKKSSKKNKFNFIIYFSFISQN